MFVYMQEGIAPESLRRPDGFFIVGWKRTKKTGPFIVSVFPPGVSIPWGLYKYRDNVPERIGDCEIWWRDNTGIGRTTSVPEIGRGGGTPGPPGRPMTEKMRCALEAVRNGATPYRAALDVGMDPAQLYIKIKILEARGQWPGKKD